MRTRARWLRLPVVLALCLATSCAAHAHLMVAQRGTLNVFDNGAFLVLSVPVSAFRGVDDDGDGALSTAEFEAHHASLEEAVLRDVRLFDEGTALALQGLMLAPSPPGTDHGAAAAHLIVMGRFALRDSRSSLRLEIELFGETAAERTLQISATRRGTDQRHLSLFTPERTAHALFPSSWTVFTEYLVLGVEHIVTGLDHLLFLLVVLATGRGWRHVLAVLTTFTAGHAITFVIALRSGVSLSPVVVEPAIALTIVGMALFDLAAGRRDRSASSPLRLALVFGCSLIHGLGLSTVLAESGLDGWRQLPGLVGFNIGVEPGQVGVALLAATLFIGIREVAGTRRFVGDTATARFATITAVLVGGAWFVERVASGV